MFFAFAACTKQTYLRSSQITFWVDQDFGCGFTSVEINGQYMGDIKNWQAFQPNACQVANNLLVVNTFEGQINLRFTNDCESWTESFYLNNPCFVYQVN
jgi:hypothetical protein